MRLISSLLIEGAASPMYRALIESNIGTDYAASTGYDQTARQTSFSVGLQGINSSQVDLVWYRKTGKESNRTKTKSR